jgi:hypothetical protein
MDLGEKLGAAVTLLHVIEPLPPMEGMEAVLGANDGIVHRQPDRRRRSR